MKEKLSKELIDFIEKEGGINQKMLTEDKIIDRDLKIYGDDAYELMEKFCVKFDVEFKSLLFDTYFNSEGSGLIDFVSIYRKFRRKNIKAKEKDLTLGDLEKAKRIGKFE